MEDKNSKWSFRKITAIEEALFNNTLERFYDLGISGLVRENIQNSLDGKLKNCEDPVKVIIKTGTVLAEKIPGIEEIKRHILSLKGENSYTKATIEHMKTCINNSVVPFVSFEDCNTKGLTGACHGEEICNGDTWGIYAYKKGVHHVESDEEWENIRGGSHGVGKIASNAASNLHLMYFANCDEQGNQHIGGTVELIEHDLEGEKYRATGYFTKVEQDKYYPYENHFNEIFSKKTRGLKIVVPYLREQFQGKEKIIRAVCDNFFVSILKQKLEVVVDDILINSDTFLEIVENKAIYEEQNYNEIKTNFTPLYVKTYIENSPIDIVIEDKNGVSYPFSLYFKYDETIKKGRVAIVRGIGMKIEDKKVIGHANTSYNAVMIPKTSTGDMFLKSLENESHTRLSYEHIKSVKFQNNAKRFINNIDKSVKEIFVSYIEKTNPADGKIDTSELIYSIERNFKKNLSRHIATVELNKDRKNGNKKLVKIKQKGSKKKTEKTKKKVIKVKKPQINKETNKERYSIKNESVKRLLLNNKEYLVFDFNEEEQYSGETVCDISFVIVDGMGNLEGKKFEINENYSEMFDRNKNCDIDDIDGNSAKNIEIKDGKVWLEMKTTEKFNPSLKFVYYVEV